MKVLSLFDGMSCGRIALDQLGIPVEKYYASEIDKYAMQVSAANYPDIEQVGDICNLDPKDYKDVDLMLAGSPCQGFSFAGKQLAFDDPRSALFFEFIRLLKAIKPKYFLLENVRMKKEFLEVITDQLSQCYAPADVDNQFLNVLGEVRFEPIFINSSLLSAQSRQRYYWTNIPGIQQPEDRGIVLRDILEDSFDSERDKAHCIDANYYKGASVEQYKKKHRRQLVNKPKKAYDIPREILKDNERQRRVYDPSGKSPTVLARSDSPKITTPKQVGIAVDIKGHDQIKRVYSPDGKSPTINTCQGGNREPKVVIGGAFRGRYINNETKQMLEMRKDNKSNAITTVGKDSIAVNEDLTWRKLTPLECERLQTVPDNYTNHVSNTQRYKMLGNGWTVEVICHILKNMEGYQNKSNGRVDVGEFSDTQS